MRILLVGLGFVGEPLAKALHNAGHHVIGLTHSESSQKRLAEHLPVVIRQADVSQSASLADSVATAERENMDWVIHCASSGRGGIDQYRAVYRDGLANLRALCPQAKVLFTSSTSVYAQGDGQWVTEEDPADPERETGQVLREAEAIAIASGGLVTRLAGIYGPGRSFILLKYLLKTAVIEGDGGRYLNQAHQQDIVRALTHLLGQEAAGIYNIVDSTPQTQRTLYQFLADHFHGELPPTAPPDYERKRGWTHKRVSNARLRATGWTPTYPSFQAAIQNDPALVSSIQTLANRSSA